MTHSIEDIHRYDTPTWYDDEEQKIKERERIDQDFCDELLEKRRDKEDQ